MSDTPPVPANCPYCHSPKVLSDAKSASAYSRCLACGEMWHKDRIPAAGFRAGLSRGPGSFRRHSN